MSDNPADILRAVCTLDPAIDRAASDVDAYADDRDLSHIKIKPGAMPCVFHIRPIGVHLFTEYVDAVPAVTAKWRRAFQAGVALMQGYPDKNGEPSTFKPRTPLKMGRREVIIIGDDEIHAVAERISIATLYEIGHLVYERTTLGKALTDGGVSWSLPPSSVAALSRIERQRVEQIQKASETASSAASATASPTSSATSSDARSGATAAPSGGSESPNG